MKAAAEAGAVGVVIFTDPIEDGDVVEGPDYAAYPAGPARAPSSVQRGSVQYLSLYPGDPLTPGQPSYNPSLPNAPKRLPRDGTPDGDDEMQINIPSIPSIPLSYEDAIPLLKSLNGKGVKLEDGQRAGKKVEGWKEGGLRDKGVEYWTGPGEEVVELTNIVEEKVTPIWCVHLLLRVSCFGEVRQRHFNPADLMTHNVSLSLLRSHAGTRTPSSPVRRMKLSSSATTTMRGPLAPAIPTVGPLRCTRRCALSALCSKRGGNRCGLLCSRLGMQKSGSFSSFSSDSSFFSLKLTFMGTWGCLQVWLDRVDRVWRGLFGMVAAPCRGVPQRRCQ